MEKKRLIILSSFIVGFIVAIAFSLIYNTGKYRVEFDTGTSDELLTRYVNKNTKVSEPVVPTKEGFVFVGWQLNGEEYDFDSVVKSNITLKASWLKEEYITIKFYTMSDITIENKTILKGQSLTELPKLSKKGYEFLGWMLNGKLYEDEKLYSDTSLVANFQKIESTYEYKVGDKVLIIGNYAEASFSTYARHSKALGWTREIVAIYEGYEFPYAVGNKNGVLGFFKESSLELR